MPVKESYLWDVKIDDHPLIGREDPHQVIAPDFLTAAHKVKEIICQKDPKLIPARLVVSYVARRSKVVI